MKRDFAKELGEFCVRLIPDMLALLRKNMIANPEKLLLELIDEQLVYLDLLAKEHSPKDYQTLNSKLNKVSKPSQILYFINQLYSIHHKFAQKSNRVLFPSFNIMKRRK